jgi:hypothetical protein
MAKRSLDLQSDIICNLIELSGEDTDFSEINSESDEETVLSGNIAGTSGSVRTATGGAHHFQSKSSSASDQSDLESDNTVDDVGYCNNVEWIVNGHKRNKFPVKHDAGIKGELKDKKSPDEIYKHFLDDKICKQIAQQINIYAQQKINEKHC